MHQTTVSGITFLKDARDQKIETYFEEHWKPMVHKVIPNLARNTYAIRETDLSFWAISKKALLMSLKQISSWIFKKSFIPNGTIQQLNMGEGKTQVIIPMISL